MELATKMLRDTDASVVSQGATASAIHCFALVAAGARQQQDPAFQSPR
jgi:hypothetical protein